MSTKDEFNLETLTFRDTWTEEALFLLRPVLQFGHLGTQLPQLPANLAALIGQACGITAAQLRSHLASIAVLEPDLGGSLDDRVSRSNGDSSNGTPAKYFVIHDTSSPLLEGLSSFPSSINDSNWPYNNLSSHLGPDAVAHTFTNRAGESKTGHDYQKAWRAMKFERSDIGFGIPVKGLFLHNELIQPRLRQNGDYGSRAPDPGFPVTQYDRLALLYVAASLRRGKWMIPMYHCPLDDFDDNGHDDPQNFQLAVWDARLGHLLEQLGHALSVAERVAGPAALARRAARREPVSALFRDLVRIYAGFQIEYPQLKPVTVAQWMLESGRGTSGLATEHLNFAGLKYREEMAGYATRVWYEAHDGGEWYCKFASLRDFIIGYWRFLDRDPYEGWREHADTGEDFIRFIGPIYDTVAYPGKVIPLIPEAEQLLQEAGSEELVVARFTESRDDRRDGHGVLRIDPANPEAEGSLGEPSSSRAPAPGRRRTSAARVKKNS